MTSATDLTQKKIDAVLASPAISCWLKTALAEALRRDCVDAANDAELLADLLGKRCHAMLGSA